LTAATDRLAVGDRVFVLADDETTPICVRGRSGVVTLLDATRAQIRVRGEHHEIVWVELNRLRTDRRRQKQRVEWRLPDLSQTVELEEASGGGIDAPPPEASEATG
jgi:hypothetical protein